MESRRCFVPRLECLEHRALPSGNVLASIASGALQITGDNQANFILVRQLVSGHWEVRGDGSTSINTSGHVFTAPGVNRIAIQMNEGNDTVAVENGQLTGTLDVSMGGGMDHADVVGVKAASAQINLEQGGQTPASNFLQFEDCVFRNTGGGGLVVNGGNLTDRVVMQSVQTERLEATLGPGAAQVLALTKVTATSNRLTASGTATLEKDTDSQLGTPDPGTPIGFNTQVFNSAVLNKQLARLPGQNGIFGGILSIARNTFLIVNGADWQTRGAVVPQRLPYRDGTLVILNARSSSNIAHITIGRVINNGYAVKLITPAAIPNTVPYSLRIEPLAAVLLRSRLKSLLGLHLTGSFGR